MRASPQGRASLPCSPVRCSPSAALRMRLLRGPLLCRPVAWPEVAPAKDSGISVLAYSFTSAPVAEALAKASKRGIRVQLVADGESNTSGGGAAKARAAMSALVSAGVSVRLVDAFAIHHDKVVIVDGRHVQTGSFNYSSSAERRNSENVLVVWDDPALARTYLTHFKRNWDLGKPYVTNY